MGRAKKSIDHKKEVKSKCDRHYYLTVTKIHRQLQREIKKAFYAYSQLDADARAKKDVTINYIRERSWTHFVVLKENLYNRNGNEQVREANKSIKAINKGLPKQYHLPALPLNKISLRALNSYTQKYFTILHRERIISKAFWTIEQTKAGVWHVHAMVDIYASDVYTERFTHFWKLNNHTYCEPISNIIGSIIYITKNWKTNSKETMQDEQFSLSNSVGNFSTEKQYNPLRHNVDYSQRLQQLALQ